MRFANTLRNLSRASCRLFSQRPGSTYITGAREERDIANILRRGAIAPDANLAECGAAELNRYRRGDANLSLPNLLIFQLDNDPTLRNLDGVDYQHVTEPTRIQPVLASYDSGEQVVDFSSPNPPSI